jgi:hypothetical protein
MLQRFLLFAVALVLIPIAPTQEPKSDEPVKAEPKASQETKIFRVHHATPHDVYLLLGSGPTIMKPSNQLGVISVTGTKEQLSWVEAEIRKLDEYEANKRSSAPEEGPGSMELQVHYIGVGVEGRAIPTDSRLNAVVEQLRRSFPYESYKLIVSYMVRAAVWDEPVRVEGIMPNLAPDPEGKLAPHRSSYQLQFKFRGFVDGPDHRAAVLRDLEAEWTIAVPSNNQWGFENTRVSLSSNIDLPEGKLVVLGKAGVPGNDTGIFLVLEARAVE